MLRPYLHIENYLIFLVSYGAYLEAISYFLLEKCIKKRKNHRRSKGHKEGYQTKVVK